MATRAAGRPRVARLLGSDVGEAHERERRFHVLLRCAFDKRVRRRGS
jgi:hypothetical protein